MPRKHFIGPVSLLSLVLALRAGGLASAQTAPVVDFTRDIHPLLQRACVECHGPDKQKGRLRLDRRADAMKSIVPGRPEESELFRRIALEKGEAGVMPARGDTLSAREREMVRAWITAGADWPDAALTTQHWAYVKPKRPDLPAVSDVVWPRNGVDQFILARLAKEGLKPSPEADKHTLIRRVSFDLIGLPPSRAEVEAFLADQSPDAYERVVERLLASPHFGERWARPWLDLARYADSHGFQRDNLRTLWPFRDWVINALNRDMPFDRFTVEQIAGDLLPEATPEQRIATGFHRAAPTNVEAGSDPEETRVNQVIDRVNTTATVWLGTTLECAQCHDHKYDPFSQRDYYRLFAFFNNTVAEAARLKPELPGSISFVGASLTADDGSAVDREQWLKKLRDIDEKEAALRGEISANLGAAAEELKQGLGRRPRAHTLEVAEFASDEGSSHQILPDRSVLLVGEDAPEEDAYTVTVRTTLRGITAFRLEVLKHPSLPGHGPARGSPDVPNFALSTFSVTATPLDKSAAPVALKLSPGGASFAQRKTSVAATLDDDPATVWAVNPRVHQNHWAAFRPEGPVDFEGGTEFTFRLVMATRPGHTIGRFRLSALTGTPRPDPVPAEVADALAVPEKDRTAAQTGILVDFLFAEDPRGQALAEERAVGEQELVKIRPTQTQVMLELDSPRRTAVFLRGDFRTPGDAVEAGTPAALSPPAGPAAGGALTRLDLARWLVHPDNPLTARVTVNRWWAELFGRGLVSTAEDFGVKGEPPTHPELLDWLATEFVERGWSMKDVLRLVVTSATYRQSSRLSPDLLARDDQNLLLARGPRFRLDAETIRDNAFAAAGLLSTKFGGPPVHPPQPAGLWTKVGGQPIPYVVSPGADSRRRAVYTVWKRTSPYPSMMIFDATPRMACTVKRSRSNTPLQALTLLNDPVYVGVARALAGRLLAERPGESVGRRIAHAYHLCLARDPGSEEVAVLRRLWKGQHAAYRADPEAARDLVGDMPLPAGVTPPEFAAWYAVATAMLNLDEMITKE